jgi:MoxR-like ATPase
MSGPEFLAMQELLTHVPIADPLTSYGASLVLATHGEDGRALPSVRRYVSYGASPRALQALVRGAKVHCVLAGRTAVAVGDIQRVARQALRHRIILNFEGEAESLDVDRLVEEILQQVPTPAREQDL